MLNNYSLGNYATDRLWHILVRLAAPSQVGILRLNEKLAWICDNDTSSSV